MVDSSEIATIVDPIGSCHVFTYVLKYTIVYFISIYTENVLFNKNQMT